MPHCVNSLDHNKYLILFGLSNLELPHYSHISGIQVQSGVRVLFVADRELSVLFSELGVAGQGLGRIHRHRPTHSYI